MSVQDYAPTSNINLHPDVRRKILVTGMGRGGTSSLSAMLYHAGFNVCGEAKPLANFEDESLRPLLIDGRLDELQEVLEVRARRYPLVAWKDPKLHGGNGLELLRRLPADWILLVVFRDPVAIVSRRTVSDQVDFVESMNRVMRFMGKLHKFVAEVQKSRKVIYVSYEKLVIEPDETILSIFRMLEIEMDAKSAESIWAQMLQSKDLYLSRDAE